MWISQDWLATQSFPENKEGWELMRVRWEEGKCSRWKEQQVQMS
jgi:hypothetical protein